MQSTLLCDLPDELIVQVASNLAPSGLLRLLASCRRLHSLPTDALWKAFCEARWEPWPRYRLSAERVRWLDAQETLPRAWIGRYRHFEADALRTEISAAELIELSWNFNFTPQAGGRGRESLVPARFSDAHLHVPGYPPLPYALRSGSGASTGGPEASSVAAALSTVRALMTSLLSTEPEAAAPAGSEVEPQQMLIAHFPPHRIRRYREEMEWVIENENVNIVSCAAGSIGSFDENSFLTLPAPPAQAPA